MAEAGQRRHSGAAAATRSRCAVVVSITVLLIGVGNPVVGAGVGAATPTCSTTEGSTGLTGTVRDSVSGEGVPGALVAILRLADHVVVAGVSAGEDARYTASVPPGAYLLYVIDPTGGHEPRLQGAPTGVTVTAGTLTASDAELVPTQGDVVGTVSDAGTGDPIGGVWAVALDATTGAPGRVAITDGEGRFTVTALRPGSHRLVYVDPAARHRPVFFGGALGPEGAAAVAVSAGGTAEADVSLPAQANVPGTERLQGTVTGSEGAAGGGYLVVALRSADFSLAGGTQTDGEGRYHLDLPPGAYKVGVLDPVGAHPMVWHDGQPYSSLGTAADVTMPATVDVALRGGAGAISGTVVDEPSGAPLPCVWLVAIDATGSVAAVGTTGEDGRYRVSGLRAGTYRLALVDPGGWRIQEYWQDSLTFAGATTLAVEAGETTTADGDLTPATPFGHPTQWVARQFTELLGRAPSPEEWTTWSNYYGSQPACTAAALTVLPMYLAGLTTPPVPGLGPGPSSELDALYPVDTPLDRALRAATVIRAAFGHDPNDGDWNSWITPYVNGTATWSDVVSGAYGFIMSLKGSAHFCALDAPAYEYRFARARDPRSKVAALYPNQSPPLVPSRTQAELESDLEVAAAGTTPEQRTVTLRPGEVVRIGGPANANQQLVVPPGVTITSEGAPPYAEPDDGRPAGLAYERMGRIVPDTSPWTPGVASGLVCAGADCHDAGMVSLGVGSHLRSVWVDGLGMSDTNHRMALVQTNGSTEESPATPYEDGTSVVASRLTDPSRDGVGLRLAGASTGTPCVNQRVLGNLVTGYASRHEFDQRGQAAWVDGITVSCEDAVVAANDIVDVTDHGIVVHGSVDRENTVVTQRSDVRSNTVLSAGLDAHVAFAADAMGVCLAAPVEDPGGTVVPGGVVPCLDFSTPRDFTGSRVRDNRFFTGSRTSFDVGLMVGGGALWGDHRATNQGPDVDHPGARGVEVTGNTTGGVPTRANVGIDVHDMTHATVMGNTSVFRLVEGNPGVTWGRCPEAQLLAGASEKATLTTDVAFSTDDRSRGCVFGEPPADGLERLEVTEDGFVGASTGSSMRFWGGDLDVQPDIEVMVADFREVRRMGVNVIRLLLETEDYLVAPACEDCDPTVDTVAVDHLGDVAAAAREAGLYLDITGNGIARHHHNGSWFDELDASPEDEERRWAAQELFWVAVATELEPYPSIAWYDLINEPALPAVGEPATSWCFVEDKPPDNPCWNPNVVKSMMDPDDPTQPRDANELADTWTIRMRDAIKVGAGDTTHPVSVGQISFCGGPLNRASQVHADFDSLHMYPQDDNVVDRINRVRNCKQPGRPLVIEETYLALKVSETTMEQWLDGTEEYTAGYLGHFQGHTTSELLRWMEQRPDDPDWWTWLTWLRWHQFSLRQVALRVPAGPGVMPG